MLFAESYRMALAWPRLVLLACKAKPVWFWGPSAVMFVKELPPGAHQPGVGPCRHVPGHAVGAESRAWRYPRVRGGRDGDGSGFNARQVPPVEGPCWQPVSPQSPFEAGAPQAPRGERKWWLLSSLPGGL